MSVPMTSIKRAVATACFGAIVALALAAAADDAPSVGAVEAIGIATEAYVYGYPLVTFDMARQQQTNVAAPDGRACPDGADDQDARAIRRSTTTAAPRPTPTRCTPIAWLDVSQEPWSSASPTWAPATTWCRCSTAGRGVQGGGPSTTGGKARPMRSPGRAGTARSRGRDAGQVAHRDGVDPRAHLQPARPRTTRPCTPCRTSSRSCR